MSSERTPDLTLFLDILHTLEDISAPYVIIRAFWQALRDSARQEAATAEQE